MSLSIRVFATFACATVLVLSEGAALADDLAYVFTESDQFGVIDLNTGAFTQFALGKLQPAGMATAGGLLYMAPYGSNAMYTVNPATGTLTLVGDAGINFYGLGSTLTGLYGLDYSGNLYSVSPANAAATLIGPTGSGQSGNILGLSTNSNSLYYAVNGNLYSLSTVNGKATLIGPTGVTGIGSMVYEGGVLYAGVTKPNLEIYSLSTTTGAGTQVSTPSGSPSPGHLWGMVPANPQTGALSLITTRSGVCANDLINWNQLPPPVATVPTPVSIASNAGVQATLTANAGSVFSDEQASGFWNGNFAAGDFLVGAGATVGASPIQITFPTPVWAVGAQMGYGSNGTFLAGISVFGPGNVQLGSYDVSGTESSAGDNSAPFIGVLDVMGGISTVEFFTLSSFGTSAGEFAINETSLNTAGSTLVASSGSPQSALVNTAFATPLTVMLTDPCGAPVDGATVSFAAPTSGASATLSAGSAVTAGNGTASVTASASGTAGSYLVTASVFGLSATFSLTNTAPPVITTSSVPPGYVGSAYSATLAAGGGTPPYSNWKIASGALPPGLKLAPSSGTIHGNPTTTTGSPFSFSVTVEDSAGHTSVPAAFSVTVNPPVTIASVHLPHTSVVGGKTTTDNQAILTGPAPSGGAVVTLTSSDPSVASVPATVKAPATATKSAIFDIVTTAVTKATPVTISAAYDGITATATITVEP